MNRLLIVDDEEHIARMLYNHFTFLDYEVQTAHSAAQARQTLSNQRFDVMISDIIMPGESGIELLRFAKKECAGMRVIMVTGYVTLQNAMSCMNYGAETCVFKPFEDLTELESAVIKAIEIRNHWQEKFKQLKGLHTE